MNITEILLTGMGVGSFIGAIVGGLTNAKKGSIVACIVFFFFTIPWVANKGISYTHHLSKIKEIEEDGGTYIKKPLWVSHGLRNYLPVQSSFLLWPQCTIMMWVFVPPEGKGLRNSPHNRYLYHIKQVMPTERGQSSIIYSR